MRHLLACECSSFLSSRKMEQRHTSRWQACQLHLTGSRGSSRPPFAKTEFLTDWLHENYRGGNWNGSTEEARRGVLPTFPSIDSLVIRSLTSLGHESRADGYFGGSRRDRDGGSRGLRNFSASCLRPWWDLPWGRICRYRKRAKWRRGSRRSCLRLPELAGLIPR